MSKENNKMQVDIENLFKQNVNDLSSIKEIYSKLEELQGKISQIKYIDSNLANKLKKDYENLKKDYENLKKLNLKDYEELKRVILDENIQAKLTDDINKINTQMDKTTNNLIEKNKISNNLFDLGFLHWNKRQENNTKTNIYIMKNETDNIISLKTNNTVNYLYQTFNIPNGHNIYVGFQAKCISSSNNIGFSLRKADGTNSTNLEIDTSNNEWQFISGTKISNGEMALYTTLSLSTNTTSNFHFKNIIVLDLTELGITKEKADLLVKTWFENSFLNKELSYVLNRAKNNGYIDAIECGCSTIIENAEKNTLLMKSLLVSGFPIKINCIIPINDTLYIDSNSSDIIGNGINTSGLLMISNDKKILSLKAKNKIIKNISLMYSEEQNNYENSIAIYFTGSSYWNYFKNIYIEKAYKGIGRTTDNNSPIWGCEFKSINMTSIYNTLIDLQQYGDGQLDNKFINIQYNVKDSNNSSFTNKVGTAIKVGGSAYFENIDIEDWQIGDNLMYLTDGNKEIKNLHLERNYLNSNITNLIETNKCNLYVNGVELCNFTHNTQIEELNFAYCYGRIGTGLCKGGIDLHNLICTKDYTDSTTTKRYLLKLKSEWNAQTFTISISGVQNSQDGKLRIPFYEYVHPENELFYRNAIIENSNFLLSTLPSSSSRGTYKQGQLITTKQGLYLCSSSGTFGNYGSVTININQYSNVAKCSRTDFIVKGEFININEDTYEIIGVNYTNNEILLNKSVPQSIENYNFKYKNPEFISIGLTKEVN